MSAAKPGRPRRPRPPHQARRSNVTAPTRHSTVTAQRPPARAPIPKPARRPQSAKPSASAKRARPSSRQIGRLVDEEDASVVDLIDNLLCKGVMLNAELILALANVDLVYVRLSALLSAADRVLPQY
jgi:gas vesicle protein GvpA/GvpJ/GvpM family